MSCPAVRGPLDATVVPLVERLRLHIARMAPHQKERHGGALLIECAAEIERLRALLTRGDRLMTRWQELYGDADHCFRNDLPLPPSGQVEWAEDVAEALRHNVGVEPVTPATEK